MNNANIVVNITNREDMVKEAEWISSQLSPGVSLCLEGDLGAGKTTLAGEIISSYLSQKTRATSPTFNIVNQYEAGEKVISHLDLYRLEKSEELINIGLEDLIEEGPTIIEWPAIAMEMIKSYSNKTLLCMLEVQGEARYLKYIH